MREVADIDHDIVVGDPAASCNGSTLAIVMVWSSSESSTLPQDEQNPDSGGFRWPHWLQNTYAIRWTTNRR